MMTITKIKSLHTVVLNDKEFFTRSVNDDDFVFADVKFFNILVVFFSILEMGCV